MHVKDLFINYWLNGLLLTEPMHDNGTQTIKAEVVEPIPEPQEMCREEANTSSTHSPSPRTVYTFSDGKVSVYVCVCAQALGHVCVKMSLVSASPRSRAFALGLYSLLFRLFSFL